MITEHPVIDIEATVVVSETRQDAGGTSLRPHHKYGASKLNYFDACDGFESQNSESEAADEGTRLHDIMDEVAMAAGLYFAEGNKEARFLPTLHMILATSAVAADDEDMAWLSFCAKEVDRWLDFGFTHKLVNELKVFVHHPDGRELNHGYLDLALWCDDTTAVLLDYKFGWIQVPPAERNLQGMDYALGLIQAFPLLQKCGAVFVQPKLGLVTEGLFLRQQAHEMYLRIRGVIDRAEGANKTLAPGLYCDYCAHNGTCTALIKNAATAVQMYEPLPFPDTFDSLQITEPEQIAKALYVIDRLEKLVSTGDLKQRALALARLNGGKFSAPLNAHENIVIESRARKAVRSATKPALIAEALSDTLTSEQVLTCCEPSITALEEVFADTLTEKRKQEAEDILADARGRAERAPFQAKLILEEAKERAREVRVTKKYAKQVLEDVLRSEGLLSRPEGLIEFVKLRVEKHPNAELGLRSAELAEAQP